MRQGWELKELGEVCAIDKSKHDGTARTYVGLEDIEANTGTYIGTRTPREMKSDTFAFDSRHVLYGRLRAYLNKLTMPDFQGHCSTEIFPLLPSLELEREYLFYWLSSDFVNARINATSTGARMPRANMNEVLTFEIPLPPVEEQKCIVAVLDEALEGHETARANAEANLKDAEELFHSSLQRGISEEAFKQGWEMKPLGDVCKFVNGFAFKSERFCSSGMPVGRIGDLNGVGLSLDKVVYANQKDYKEKLDKYVVQPGQLLIAMSGATTGKLGFNNTGQLIYQNQRVGRFLPSATLDVKYLYYYLTTKIANLLAISAGAAQPNLSTKQINEVEIPLPPLEEQKRIASKLDDIRANLSSVAQQYKGQSENIKTLRQSLLQKAFAGELT